MLHHTVVFHLALALFLEFVLGDYLDVIDVHLLKSRLYHIDESVGKLYEQNLGIRLLLSDLQGSIVQQHRLA